MRWQRLIWYPWQLYKYVLGLLGFRTFGARVIAQKGGKILLMRPTYIKGLYLPGGGVDRGEDPMTAAIRELREEAGIEMKDIKLLGLYHSRREKRDDYIAIYTAQFKSQKVRKNFEVQALVWCDPRKLPADTSPATRRRIEEFLGQREISTKW